MSQLSAVLAALLVLPNLAPAFQPPAGQLHHRPLVSRTSPSGGRRSQLWVAVHNTAERRDTLPRIETGGGSAAPAASSANLTELSRVAPSSMTVKDAALEASTLAESYKRSGEITKIFSKTFYFGTSLMSDMQREAVWAIYVWCRRTDDIVDSPVAMLQGPEKLTAEIKRWEERLEACWEGEPTDVLDLALVDTKRKYPELSIAPFKDMLLGMLMDTPGHPIAQDRYQTWDELYTYCYRVAGTVGLMTLPIMGTAPGCTFEQAERPALALGLAFQITNILRDVGEDAVRGRIYLPLEDLAKFGVTEQQIFDGEIDENYVNLIKFEIARAREYYVQAEEGIAMLAPEARLPVRASLDMYSKILRRIEENEYDNFRKRAYVSKFEKFLDLPMSWWMTQPQNLKQ